MMKLKGLIILSILFFAETSLSAMSGHPEGELEKDIPGVGRGVMVQRPFTIGVQHTLEALVDSSKLRVRSAASDVDWEGAAPSQVAHTEPAIGLDSDVTEVDGAMYYFSVETRFEVNYPAYGGVMTPEQYRLQMVFGPPQSTYTVYRILEDVAGEGSDEEPESAA